MICRGRPKVKVAQLEFVDRDVGGACTDLSA